MMVGSLLVMGQVRLGGWVTGWEASIISRYEIILALQWQLTTESNQPFPDTHEPRKTEWLWILRKELSKKFPSIELIKRKLLFTVCQGLTHSLNAVSSREF